MVGCDLKVAVLDCLAMKGQDPLFLPTVAYLGMRLEQSGGVKPRGQCSP